MSPSRCESGMHHGEGMLTRMAALPSVATMTVRWNTQGLPSRRFREDAAAGQGRSRRRRWARNRRHGHLVRLIVSAMIQYFSLTTKQHQSAYKSQKRSSEQNVCLHITDIRVIPSLRS